MTGMISLIKKKKIFAIKRAEVTKIKVSSIKMNTAYLGHQKQTKNVVSDIQHYHKSKERSLLQQVH